MTKIFNLQNFFNTGMKNLLKVTEDIFSSWLKKPQGESMGAWLNKEIQIRSGIDSEKSEAISKAIMKYVNKFNENLQEIEQKCKQGETKEEWLKQKLNELPPDKEAAVLTTLQHGIGRGNNVIEQAIQSEDGIFTIEDDVEVNEDINQEQWNPFTKRQVINEIKEKVAFASSAGLKLADNLPQLEPSKELADNNINFVEESVGSEVDSSVKAIAATAITVALHKKWISFLAKKIPTSIIANIACWGVEAVRLAEKISTQEISPLKGIEYMGRVTSVVVVDVAKDEAANKMVALIPVAGSTVGVAVAIKIAEQAKTALRDVIYQGFHRLQPIANKITRNIIKAVEKVKVANKTVKNLLFK